MLMHERSGADARAIRSALLRALARPTLAGSRRGQAGRDRVPLDWATNEHESGAIAIASSHRLMCCWALDDPLNMASLVTFAWTALLCQHVSCL